MSWHGGLYDDDKGYKETVYYILYNTYNKALKISLYI